MNKKTFLKCYVCALFFATAAYAESGHSMKGTVADANGKPLSGVLVQVPGTKMLRYNKNRRLPHTSHSKESPYVD